MSGDWAFAYASVAIIVTLLIDGIDWLARRLAGRPELNIPVSLRVALRRKRRQAAQPWHVPTSL